MYINLNKSVLKFVKNIYIICKFIIEIDYLFCYRDTHRTSVYMFLRQHRLDEEKQQAAQFLMSQDALIK